MFNLLRKSWWKWAGAYLLIISVTASLCVPLAPGVISVSEYRVALGETYELEIETYNTNLKKAEESLIVMLQYEVDEQKELICASSVEVTDNYNLKATFDLPSTFPRPEKAAFFSLICNNDIDGTFELREAMILDKENSEFGLEGYFECEPEVSTNEPDRMVFPFRETLRETIRNLMLHVPMWFTMTFLVLFSFISSLMYLRTSKESWDVLAMSSAVTAILFGFLGLFTGMLWANYTWGHPWPGDAKLNGAAIGVLTYLAYLVLRGSLDDPEKRARISAVYSVFAFVIYVLFVFVLPRLTDSLHPGNGGNPAFSQYDLDNTLRKFFYPAVIGWAILGFWIMSIYARISLIRIKFWERD